MAKLDKEGFKVPIGQPGMSVLLSLELFHLSDLTEVTEEEAMGIITKAKENGKKEAMRIIKKIASDQKDKLI